MLTEEQRRPSFQTDVISLIITASLEALLMPSLDFLNPVNERDMPHDSASKSLALRLKSTSFSKLRTVVLLEENCKHDRALLLIKDAELTNAENTLRQL